MYDSASPCQEKVGSALSLGRQAGDLVFFLAPPVAVSAGSEENIFSAVYARTQEGCR